MGKSYWMVVQTHENYRISRDLGLTVHGLRRRHRRRAERMRPDDKLLYYISDLKKVERDRHRQVTLLQGRKGALDPGASRRAVPLPPEAGA